MSDIMPQVARRVWFWFFFFFCKKFPTYPRKKKNTLSFTFVFPCLVFWSHLRQHFTRATAKGKKIQSGGMRLAAHSNANNHKPAHALQTAANAAKKLPKTPIRLFSAMKVCTCLRDPSKMSLFHDLKLVYVRNTAVLGVFPVTISE